MEPDIVLEGACGTSYDQRPWMNSPIMMITGSSAGNLIRFSFDGKSQPSACRMNAVFLMLVVSSMESFLCTEIDKAGGVIPQGVDFSRKSVEMTRASRSGCGGGRYRQRQYRNEL